MIDEVGLFITFQTLFFAYFSNDLCSSSNIILFHCKINLDLFFLFFNFFHYTNYVIYLIVVSSGIKITYFNYKLFKKCQLKHLLM